MAKSYVDLLRRFDRKERGWVVRQILEQPARLSEAFCKGLADTFGLTQPPPTDSWWAIDYHLDWLIASTRYGAPDFPGNLADIGCEGSIEDIDLLIAAPDRLFLVEAKAAGNWSNRQLTRKLDRLTRLCPDGQLRFEAADQAVPLHFGILSLGKPSRVKRGDWPDWIFPDAGPLVVKPLPPAEAEAPKLAVRGRTTLRVVETRR